MKKTNSLKKMLIGVTAFCMMFSLVACGNNNSNNADNASKSNSSNSSQAEKTAVSKEDYEASFNQLATDLEAIQSDAANIDTTDVEASKKLLEDLKKPFSDFMSIVPPTEYEEAHQKISSGCQAMIDYIDGCSALVGETDTTKIQEATATLTEHLQTAVADLMEGSELISSASSAN